MTFKELGFEAPILKALDELGYQSPTPIQAQSIPILLQGNDLLGVAQTGTGKTAAFGLPIIQLLLENAQRTKGRKKIQALIVTPTRELALQISENLKEYCKYTDITNSVIFGGVGQHPQVKALQKGIDILVATPGRLLDLSSQGYVRFQDLKYVVLDEADQMLDMGFIHDIKKIIAKLPPKRQSLFFSATMPKTIVELSRRMLGEFEQVTIRPEKPTADKVEQGVYFVTKALKPKLLVHILADKPNESVLIFSRTKHGANNIVKKLGQEGIEAAAIHGNKSQTARQKALGSFKDGKLKVLVATDIAARGIDVDELSLVINYDLPNVSETYVHRIGRTGRASASGTAISFCNREERAYLKDIEKLIRQSIPHLGDHPFMEGIESEVIEKPKKPQQRSKRSYGGGSSFRGPSSGRPQRSARQGGEGRSQSRRKG